MNVRFRTLVVGFFVYAGVLVDSLRLLTDDAPLEQDVLVAAPLLETTLSAAVPSLGSTSI